MAALAADSVIIQRLLDAATARQRERFLRVLSSAPASIQTLLLPLAPPSQTLTSHRVACRVRMSVNHSVHGGIVVAPVNLGFTGLYATTREEECSLTVEVTTSPHPAQHTLPRSR